jgi:hypothetical protein
LGSVLRCAVSWPIYAALWSCARGPGSQRRSGSPAYGGVMIIQLLTGLLGGLLALAGSLVVLLVQGRQQRALAQDERQWTRRAETYVAVLQYQASGMVEDYRGPRTASEWAIRDELMAKVAAFATDAVRELWQQSALASLSLNEYVSEEWPQWSAATGHAQQELESEMEMDEAFRRYHQAKAHAERRLAEQVHGELNADHRGRSPIRRRQRSGSLTAVPQARESVPDSGVLAGRLVDPDLR